MEKENSKVWEGKIIKISGPLVVATGVGEKAKMYEVVKVGEKRLVGEIIKIVGDDVYIQVYEDTSGVGVGEKVWLTGESLMVELGPGLISSIYDGIQRPLDVLAKQSGSFIQRGIEIESLDRQKKWHFLPKKKEGEKIEGGDVIGEVKETPLLIHKIMIPPFVKNGILEFIAKEDDYSLEEVIAKVKHQKGEIEIKMYHKWPIRTPRPVKEKLLPSTLLTTGQRVIDTFFPIAKGGTGCVPGPFGSGKTIIQHQFAKWADADVIIFVGCGERGNEMTDLLMEFPHLKDPKTERPLMERTILIANTSNMPVAAREASVYTGITIGEYFRDMGYSVLLLADSTSRWAEALREISGRMEEMPGEEGYPAYLGSRTAAFYERAGYVKTLGKDEREGFLTVIGAVSPPGGDLSEPVTQNTLTVTKVFLALDSALAYRRHFPAINWLTSYSLYEDNLKDFFEKAGEGFLSFKKEAMAILQKEAELEEVVRLVGIEALSLKDQFLLEIARMIREDFLHQNAFDPVDTFSSLRKQYLMLKTIITLYHQGNKLIEQGKPIEEFLKPDLKEKISKMKFIEESNLKHFEFLRREIENL